MFSEREVFDRGPNDFTARHNQGRAISGPKLCCSETDVLHLSFDGTGLDAVADAKGFLKHDDERPQKIGEGLLSRQSDRKAANPEPRHDRIRRKTNPVGSFDQDSDGDSQSQKTTAQPNQLAVGTIRFQALELDDPLGQPTEPPPDQSRQGDVVQTPEPLRQEGIKLRGEKKNIPQKVDHGRNHDDEREGG